MLTSATAATRQGRVARVSEGTARTTPGQGRLITIHLVPLERSNQFAGPRHACPRGQSSLLVSSPKIPGRAAYAQHTRIPLVTNPKTKIFICHASEDKDRVARPLAEAFIENGYACWYDDREIAWGDSITQRVSEGLRTSTHIVVVLSDAFVNKEYPRAELETTLHRAASRPDVEVLLLLVEDTPATRQVIETFPFLGYRRFLVWSDNPSVVVSAFRSRTGVRSKRVCMVSSEYPPVVHGGLGAHVAALTTALGDYVEVDVILPDVPDGYKEYSTLSAAVHPRPMMSVNASYDDPVSWVHFAYQIPDYFLRLQRPDIVHCHDWVTVLGALKCRAHGVPMVYHVHLPNMSPLCASIENLGLICADLVTVNSEAVQKELRDRGFPIKRIEVVPNGVDVSVFYPAESWPRDDDYVLFVGRLVEQKGVEHLLRAFAYVVQKFPRVRLKLVGEGGYRPSLERLARNLSIDDQVDFVGWLGDVGLKRRMYQNASLLAVPSVYEPFGMTALEAMACKRPVVASKTGGLRQIVKNGVTGFQVATGDHLDIAQRIMALLADSAMREELGANALKAASDPQYDWKSIAARFLELYDSITEDKPLDLGLSRAAWRHFNDFRDQIFSEVEKFQPGATDSMLEDLFSTLGENS